MLVETKNIFFTPYQPVFMLCQGFEAAAEGQEGQGAGDQGVRRSGGRTARQHAPYIPRQAALRLGGGGGGGER